MYLSEYTAFTEFYNSAPFKNSEITPLGKMFVIWFNLDIDENRDIYKEKNNNIAEAIITKRYLIH